MNRKRNPFVFIFAVALLSSLPSLWAGARKVYVQGKLTDSGGTPLSGAQTVTFKLYDAATAGTMVWTSGVLSVTPASGGLFNVPLQDGAPSLDSVSFDKPYFLGITVGADAEMTPRQELGASALSHGSSGDFQVKNNLIVKNGNVGFGTSNPQDKVHFFAPGGIQLQGDQSAIKHVDTGGTLRFLTGLRSDVGGSTNFTFHSYGGNWIFNNGNVGFGISAPTVRIDVAGDVRATGLYYASDRTLKKNIHNLPSDTLNKAISLNGVSYDWDLDAFKKKYKKNDRSKKGSGASSSETTMVPSESEDGGYTPSTVPQIGLIAQEVESQFPELVHTDGDGMKSVDYGKFTAVLLEAMKTQQKLIVGLRDEVDQLKKKVK